MFKSKLRNAFPKLMKQKQNIENRRKRSDSKRLVKLTRFKSFPLKLSGHQDMRPIVFVLRHQL